MTRKLIVWRLRIWWANQRGGRNLYIKLFGIAFTAALALGSLIFSRRFFEVVATAPFGPAGRIPSVDLSTGAVTITFGAAGLFRMIAGIRSGVTRLFLASDLDFLLAAPIPDRSLFALKLAEAAAAHPLSGALIFGVGYGYLSAKGIFGAVALLIALLVLVALAVVAAAPGLILAMALPRLIPIRKLTAGLAVLPALMSLLIVLLTSSIGGRVESGEREFSGIERTVERFRGPARWLPVAWPGNIVIGAGHGDWMLVLSNVVLLMAAITLLAALAYLLFRSTFYVSWGRINTASGRHVRPGLLSGAAAPLPQTLRALVTKDWRIMRRDLKALMQLFVPLFTISILTFNSVRQGHTLSSPDFLVAFMLGSVATQGFIQEAPNLALLKAAPVRAAEILAGKFLTYAIPAIPLAAMLSGAVSLVQHRSPGLILTFVAGTIWATAGLILLNLTFSALLLDFTSDKPRMGFPATLASIVAALIFMAVSFGSAAWIYLALSGGWKLHIPIGVSGVAVCVALAGVMTGMWILTRSALARLDRIEPL